MLNFHRECWNPVKKHWKALVFFAVSKQIPIVYSANRGRAEIKQASAVIGKQVLAFGKSEKSEFINIRIFAASSEGHKGRRHIGRFSPDRERSHVKYSLEKSCFYNLSSVKLWKTSDRFVLGLHN